MSTSKASPRKNVATRKAAPTKVVKVEDKREKFVIFLRHGIAEELSPDKKDEDRGLTAEGHAKMKWIARGLERALPKVGAIYSSPLLRAVQTSLWVSKAYRSRVNVTTSDALTPGAKTRDFFDLLASIRVTRAIVVGHEPSLSDNVRKLTRLSQPETVELKKGGCYGVRLRPDGTAILEWALPPRILRKLGEGGRE
jgi:phosphohistidine phosphatase